jgi:hypothetical protein
LTFLNHSPSESKQSHAISTSVPLEHQELNYSGDPSKCTSTNQMPESNNLILESNLHGRNKFKILKLSLAAEKKYIYDKRSHR